ncbi:Rv3235 family protein [Nocardia sp. AG03]|uniref:Rv3235 family protein n=1 Tax=Nocardia sp. AG03 TaxID=3025312 RepID=UPI0024182CCA|nr:Rv3235 family protein [Nocardia sp. AG03]
MSTDPTSLSYAPHCEPRLSRSGGELPAAANSTAAQVIRGYPRNRRSGAPLGIRLAVRRGCQRDGQSGTESTAGVTRRPDVGFAEGAERFAEQAVRSLLEVIDRRRTLAQLDALVDQRVLSAVETILRRDLAPGRSLGAATAINVRLTSRETDAAEMFATYQRGKRTLALAGRVEITTRGWRLVAMRLY